MVAAGHPNLIIQSLEDLQRLLTATLSLSVISSLLRQHRQLMVAAGYPGLIVQ